MAKKQKNIEVESTPQVEEPKVETQGVEKPITKRKEPTYQKSNDGWEIKARRYKLINGMRPLTFTITPKGFYFDREKGYEREIRLTENQNTPFVDEFKGSVIPGRIIFINGELWVPENKVMLQKFLSIYHPQAGKTWIELKPKAVAENQLDVMNLEVDAMLAARDMDIDMVEAIMRVEIGSKVSEMSSKELKRDSLLFAKRNPKLFLELMKDDNIHLRNLGIKAVENGIIALSRDQRTFTWKSTGRKLLNVPFEEHPYSALAAWFKTDEGMEVLQSVEKQLN